LFNQPRPDRRAYRSWKKFLRTIATPDRKLRQSLKDWTAPYIHCRRYPPWVYNAPTQQLYSHITRNHYQICERVLGGFVRPSGTQRGPTVEPPPQAYPVVVIDLGPRVMIRPHVEVLSSSPRIPLSFSHYLQSLDPWEEQLLRGATLTSPVSDTLTMLNEGPELYIASDGSVIEGKFASFGFTIHQAANHRKIAMGNGPVPGGTPTSFRAEAYGVLAVGRLLLRLQQFSGILISQRVSHWIDNQAVVSRIQDAFQSKYASPNATLHPDWDVVNAIAHTFAQLHGVTYKARWIKSHQDTQTAYDQLSWEAQMNCDADGLASVFQQSPQGRIHLKVVPILPNTVAQLEVSGSTVTGRYKSVLRQRATLPMLEAYLTHRFGWDNEVLGSLDWEVLRVLISSYDEQRPTLVKHLHAIAPTGKYAHRNDHHESQKCPACPHEVETNDHMMRCPAESRL